MNTKDINQYPIKKYLAELYMYPAKEKSSYGMYNSPFREDPNASMKVSYTKNLWIDYGANEGGTLIDLVMRIKNCSNGEAIRLLINLIGETSSFSFHKNNSLTNKPETDRNSINIVSVNPLLNPALFNYLKERYINTEIAKLYCNEVHYSVKDKQYFAIGFKNDSGGYELRNKYFKGCTSKEITTFKNQYSDCLIFEGFTDFLSYLTLKNIRHIPEDVAVLNSVINLSKSKEFLLSHKTLYTFLDNDLSGKKSVGEISSFHRNVIDQSKHYSNHKDLNDFLIEKGKNKKKSRGMKR